MKEKKVIFYIITCVLTLMAVALFVVAHYGLIGTVTGNRCKLHFDSEQYHQAFNACNNDNVDMYGNSSYILGILYLKGLGTVKDTEMAYQLFRSSAKKGNTKAKIQLADLYIKEKKWAFALQVLMDSKDQSPVVKYRIAELYYQLWKKSKKKEDEVMSLFYLNDATEAKFAPAYALKGYFFSVGFGVKKDIHKAIKLYKKYFESKDDNNEVSTLTTGAFSLHVRMLYGVALFQLKQNYNLSLNLLKQGEKTGLSTLYIADIYFDGLGIERNTNEALKWYRKSIQMGNVDAIVRLADHLMSGVAIKKDQKQAIKLFTLAARKKSVIAMEKLGHIYREGIGVKPSYLKSIQWYKMAEKYGSVLAKRKIREAETDSTSHCMAEWELIKRYDGPQIQQKKKQIYNICLSESNRGRAIAKFILAKFYLKGDIVKKNPAKAMILLRKSADLGYARAQFFMAQFYEFGLTSKLQPAKGMNHVSAKKMILMPNSKLAYLYYTKYVSNTSSRKLKEHMGIASYNLFLLLYRGFGVPVNRERALQQLVLAVKYEHPPAISRMAYHRYIGDIIPSNKKKALELWARASELGLTKPDPNLTLCYVYLVPYYMNVDNREIRDYKKGYQYCSIAAKNNHILAMKLLSRLYLKGLGVKKNIKLYNYWCKKAGGRCK